MAMQNVLLELDQRLFFWINRDLSNQAFDIIFPVVTDYRPWIVVFLPALVYFVYKKRREAWLFLGLILVVFALSDGIGSLFLKPFFARLRPYKALEGVNKLVGSGSFSFPSNHAANTTSIWFLIYRRYRPWAIRMLWIPPLIYFSRIYVGVHYPADILGGMLWGLSCAILVLFFWEKAIYKMETQEKSNLGEKEQIFSEND